MKCDMKTMLKAGLGVAAVAVVGYMAFPAARDLILATSPLLFLLLCPLMMFFMMKSMHSHHTDNGIHKNVPTPSPEAIRIEQSPQPLDQSKALRSEERRLGNESKAAR